MPKYKVGDELIWKFANSSNNDGINQIVSIDSDAYEILWKDIRSGCYHTAFFSHFVVEKNYIKLINYSKLWRTINEKNL